MSDETFKRLSPVNWYWEADPVPLSRSTFNHFPIQKVGVFHSMPTKQFYNFLTKIATEKAVICKKCPFKVPRLCDERWERGAGIIWYPI